MQFHAQNHFQWQRYHQHIRYVSAHDLAKIYSTYKLLRLVADAIFKTMNERVTVLTHDEMFILGDENIMESDQTLK
jgi:hypothetical protein